MGTLTNIEDTDDNAAYHQGLCCLLRLKQYSKTEIHHNSEKCYLCTQWAVPYLLYKNVWENPSEYKGSTLCFSEIPQWSIIIYFHTVPGEGSSGVYR